MPEQHINRSMAQRRALIAECRRRMEAGETTSSIIAALQIPKATFYKWAKIHGFRRGDLNPDDPRARTRAPAGPSSGTSSGRYLRGEGLGRPRSGGRQAALTPEEAAHFKANPAEAHLEALRARDRGDLSRIDAISRLMKKEKSREGDIDKLEEIAKADPNYVWSAYEHECMARWEDDELLARVTFKVVHDLDRSVKEPPIHTRAPQEWIDKYLAVSHLPRHQALAVINGEYKAPDMPGPFDQMGETIPPSQT